MTKQERNKYRRKYWAKCNNKRVDKLGNLIEMRLTFDEWLQVWIDSGHIHEMGGLQHQYHMCRKDDIGHYEIGNVFIDLGLNNVVFTQQQKLTDYDLKVNDLVQKTGYSRRTVRSLIEKGALNLD